MDIQDSIEIEFIKRDPIEQQRVEIVERKGIGHPDTICDSVMNYAAVELFNVYEKELGDKSSVHFNLDKCYLKAGAAEHRFGGGIVKEPILFILGDRATNKVDDLEIPVYDIVSDAAKRWLKENLRYIKPEEHVRFQNGISQGSAALTDIFRRSGSILGANDTSAAVGYAPRTRTEHAVFSLERYLNSPEFHEEFPSSGEDVKVMGVRRGNNIKFTVGLPMVDSYVKSENDYFEKKGEMRAAIIDKLKSDLPFDAFEFDMNTLDMPGRGVDGVYLTIAGTCADCADSGQVGRGNKPSGLISLSRGAGAEAAAGKNPTSHVGKIYNLLAQKIADGIYKRLPNVAEVDVYLVSQIGRPIDSPYIINPKIVLNDGADIGIVEKEINEILYNEFGHIREFCQELALGKIPVC